MSENINRLSLPPSMYEGGFAHSGRALQMSFELTGLRSPVTVYYPGSSTDISLARIDGVHTIHADKDLEDDEIEGFKALGAEAYAVDVHAWEPPKAVDAVAFINPTGINATTVLNRVQLRDGGIVLWASWDGVPKKLQDSGIVTLAGVISHSDDDDLILDTNDLADFFAMKSYSELGEDERLTFIERFNHYLDRQDLATDLPLDELFELLKLPEHGFITRGMNFRFPYKKTGTFYIFKKLLLGGS